MIEIVEVRPNGNPLRLAMLVTVKPTRCFDVLAQGTGKRLHPPVLLEGSSSTVNALGGDLIGIMAHLGVQGHLGKSRISLSSEVFDWR